MKVKRTLIFTLTVVYFALASRTYRLKILKSCIPIVPQKG